MNAETVATVLGRLARLQRKDWIAEVNPADVLFVAGIDHTPEEVAALDGRAANTEVVIAVAMIKADGFERRDPFIRSFLIDRLRAEAAAKKGEEKGLQA